ncbi:hypothetical protein WJX72_009926 [[Myrmecia] bisecta]|uniref:Uncharacterized protein n=1 Tax=[Myrmecia] bisecta TaxID=41462 RepID=A0AAW1PYD9_9CHLO
MYGQRWSALFPRQVAAVTRHAGWEEFAAKVLAGDRRSKLLAQANMKFKGSPVETMHRIFLGLKQIVGEEAEASPLPAPTELLSDKECLVRHTFSLAGLETVEQGVALFRIVDSTPQRLWAGSSKRQRTSFKAAMYQEITDDEDAVLREESRAQFCALRPTNTQYAYATGQRNYEEWCASRQFDPRKVTDAKTRAYTKYLCDKMDLRSKDLRGVATAARMDDVLVLRLRDLHLHPFDHSQPGKTDFAGTWVGRDPSHAVSFNTVDGKSVQPSQVGNKSCVRYLHLDICPLSALADLLISMLSRPGKLCAEFSRTRQVLVAPNSSGEKPMAYNTVRKYYKEVLLSVGVDCEAVVMEGDKHEVSHLFKKLSIALLKLKQGLPFSDISRAAGHSHNVTDDSYSFTTDPECDLLGCGSSSRANFKAQVCL